VPFGVEKLELCGYPTVKTFKDMFILFDRIHERDRRTHRHGMTAKAARQKRCTYRYENYRIDNQWLQPTSKTSALLAQWSTPPVEQTFVRPIAVTCSSCEPGHSSADEAPVWLLQLSGTVFRFIYAHRLSVEDNSELG